MVGEEEMMLTEYLTALPPGVRLLVAIGAAAIVAYLIAEACARLARAVMMAVLGEPAGEGFLSPIVRRPVRVVRTAVLLIVLAALLVPALEMAGLRLALGSSPAVLSVWLLGSGLRVILIALLAYLVLKVIGVVARRIEAQIGQGAPGATERVKRARTLSRLVQRALTATVLAIAGLTVLRELGVDILPILTGAGIIGLAVGFGAQTLVKDLISGFFLILENQIRVGDVAIVNGTGGLVEAIDLRTIVLRDLHGVVHIFPNGSVERLANMTKDFSCYVIDVGVAYKEDPDEVMDVLRAVGAELAADPRFGPSILEPLEILGVDAFGDSQVTIKIRIKTVPLKQWEVGRELRRRIKKAFDARQIEIPFPHVSLYFGEASKPILFRQAS